MGRGAERPERWPCRGTVALNIWKRLPAKISGRVPEVTSKTRPLVPVNESNGALFSIIQKGHRGRIELPSIHPMLLVYEWAPLWRRAGWGIWRIFGHFYSTLSELDRFRKTETSSTQSPFLVVLVCFLMKIDTIASWSAWISVSFLTESIDASPPKRTKGIEWEFFAFHSSRRRADFDGDARTTERMRVLQIASLAFLLPRNRFRKKDHSRSASAWVPPRFRHIAKKKEKKTFRTHRFS